MEIRELDLRTAEDDELLALHDLEQRCAPPRWAFRSAAESLVDYRHWPRGVRRRWRAGDAGAAALFVHGPNHTYAEIRVVPECRRRGVGTELLAAVRQAAREEGASSFFAHHWDDAGATVEGLREDEATAARRGRDVRVTVALDAAGSVVAFTDLRAAHPPSPVATTDDTATVREARLQGLSTAVKLESLRRLRAERPDVEVVTTMNAEHNVAMRAVNTKIGFVPRVTLTTTVLSL